MASVLLVIDTQDYRGTKVVFTHKKWKEKVVEHADLKNSTFLKNVKQTIENPTEVWPDYSDKRHKRCYYKKYSTHSYVKVVVWFKGNPACVVTAFETNYIKESKYPELRRLK